MDGSHSLLFRSDSSLALRCRKGAIHPIIRSPRRRSDGRVRKGRCPNHSGVPLAFAHETVLGGAVELLALRAHRLWRACLPFTFFQKAERAAPASGLPFL